MKQIATKISAILLGIVLGLDLSGFFGSEKVVAAFAPEWLIIGFAVLVIVFEFFEGQLARQACRFVLACIVGVAFRECTQIPIEACMCITIVGIIAIAAAVVIKHIATSKLLFDKLENFSEEEGYEEYEYESEDDDSFQDYPLPEEEDPEDETQLSIVEIQDSEEESTDQTEVYM